MRENNFSKKDVGFYYVQFKVKKSFISTALNAFRSGDVRVFDVKVEDKNFAYFSVLKKDEKKVFAIIKELWYNEKVVEKVASYGTFYPFYALFTSVGLLLGLIFFVVVFFISSSFIIDIEFTGSGKEYKREVISVLNENGVCKNKSIKGVDLNDIKNQLLKSSANFSFVEIKKEGFRLVVELELATNGKPQNSTPSKELRSPYSGQIVSLKTYRGTALMKVGDFVNAGELLVGGYNETAEERIECSVIASAIILTKSEYEYFSTLDGDEENALLFAEQALGEDYENSEIEKIQKENGYLYKVQLQFKREINAT